MFRTVAITLALVSVAVAIGSDSTDENEFAAVPLPPTAREAFHEEDPKADALMKAESAKDKVMDFMQDAMMKTGAFMPKDDKAALDLMDADLANQKAEEAAITKTINSRQKANTKLHSAMSRFDALRSKYTSFSEIEESHPKKKRHTMAKPHFEAPPHYDAVPEGTTAKNADAGLASGADSNRKEDWKVHQETYKELHPEAFEHEHKAVAKKKHKAPTPLKDAERDEHHAIQTIHSTKKIIEKEPKRLTLKEAKTKCVAQKKAAKSKCKAGKEAKELFCKEKGTTTVQCSKHGMTVAAECKVAHETAYKQCLSLWKEAKQIIADRNKRKAAPMKVSDKQAHLQEKKSVVCSTLMKKSADDCKKHFAASKASCKKKMKKALDMEESEFLTVVKGIKAKAAKAAKKKAHKSAKKASKSASKLRGAKAALAKAGASGAMSKAAEHCAIVKNDAKRHCMSAIQDADDHCTKLLTGEMSLKKPKAAKKGKKAKKAKKGKKAAKKKAKKKDVEEFDEEDAEVDPTDPTMFY